MASPSRSAVAAGGGGGGGGRGEPHRPPGRARDEPDRGGRGILTPEGRRRRGRCRLRSRARGDGRGLSGRAVDGGGVGQRQVRELPAERVVVRVDLVAGGERVDQLAGLRRAFQRLYLDVDDVVGEAPPVREALLVAAEPTEPVGCL